jgi:hypothetical protein
MRVRVRCRVDLRLITERDDSVTDVIYVVNLPRKGHKPGDVREAAQVLFARQDTIESCWRIGGTR